MGLVFGVGLVGRLIGEIRTWCEAHLLWQAQGFCDWQFLGFLACCVCGVGKDLGEFLEEAHLGRWEVGD